MRQRLDRLTPEQRAQIGQPPVRDPITGLPPGVVRGPGPVIRDLPGGEVLRGGQPVMLDNRQGSGGYMSGGRGGSERPNPIFEGPVPTPPGPPNQGLPPPIPLPGQTPPMSIVAPGGAGGSIGTVYTPGQPPQRIPSVDELLRSGQPGQTPDIDLAEFLQIDQPGSRNPTPSSQYFSDIYNGMDIYGRMTPGQALGGSLTQPGPQVQPPQFTAQASPDPLASQMSQYLGIAQNFNK